MNAPVAQHLSEPRIIWERQEQRVLVGFYNSKKLCVINIHWTGAWLDGFSVPIKCRDENDAKVIAERELQMTEKGK